MKCVKNVVPGLGLVSCVAIIEAQLSISMRADHIFYLLEISLVTSMVPMSLPSYTIDAFVVLAGIESSVPVQDCCHTYFPLHT
jgi:hypothetical protein